MSPHLHNKTAVAPAEVLDPVCGMTISPDEAVGHIDQKGPGACPKCGMALEPVDLSPITKVEWTCPMHPEIVRDAPGACPICGMALESRTITIEERNPELDDMTRRLAVSLLLTAPILAVMVSELLPGQPLHR